MLTKEEIKFMEYWELNRNRKKRVFRQLAVGLPLGVAIVLLIFANFFSGWFKRAEMKLRAEPSLMLVIIGAALLIVVFITVFSAWHKWDMHEQRYRELMTKKKNE
jgi:small-conductance mechanosensitive channel